MTGCGPHLGRTPIVLASQAGHLLEVRAAAEVSCLAYMLINMHGNIGALDYILV